MCRTRGAGPQAAGRAGGRGSEGGSAEGLAGCRPRLFGVQARADPGAQGNGNGTETCSLQMWRPQVQGHGVGWTSLRDSVSQASASSVCGSITASDSKVPPPCGSVSLCVSLNHNKIDRMERGPL